MSKLDEIEAIYKAQYEFGNIGRAEWANTYGSLLIRAVRQLKPVYIDALLALDELERLDRDAMSMELKSAYMILRERLRDFDRRRLSRGSFDLDVLELLE